MKKERKFLLLPTEETSQAEKKLKVCFVLLMQQLESGALYIQSAESTTHCLPSDSHCRVLHDSQLEKTSQQVRRRV